MSKRNQHIEKWLRQAAAQDPEVSPEQVKQQAWAQLNDMLESGDNVSDLPRSSGSGWWVILLEVLVLVAGFGYLWMGHQQKIDVVQQDVLLTQERAALGRSTSGLSASNKEPATSTKLPSSLNDILASSTKTSSGSNEELSVTKISSGYSNGLVSSTKLPSSLKDIPALSTKKSSASKDKHTAATKTSFDLNNKPTSSIKKASSSKHILTPSTKKLSSSKNKPILSSTSKNTSATYWNTDPLEKDANGQWKGRPLVFTGNAPSEALKTLLTKQLFIPVKDSGVNNIPLPKASRKQKGTAEKPSGFSVRIAAIAPIAEAYGAGANIEYTFAWRNKWRVRPYAGAEYLTGFNKEYEHVSYTATPGSGFFQIDSTVTIFPLKGMLYGKAGVQAVYAFSKWEASAGVEYRYLFAAAGKEDSSLKRRFSSILPAPLQPLLFDKKQVTGSGNLRLQLGLDYWISPRMQVGAIYYIQTTKHTVDSTYRSPAPKLPDQTSLQIHARYYLKKR